MNKIPKKGTKKMPVYSKVSGLDTTKKGGQERTNDYTVNQSKAYNKDTPRPNFENLAAGGSAFKMKGFSGHGNSPVKKAASCWKGYKAAGKKKSPSGKKTSSGKTKMVNNCVKA
jgi:hypothetical protein|tara:strand:+ start:710 stop:1051 length:342 start_codon:yes stop_codon:yes gene_type:complete